MLRRRVTAVVLARRCVGPRCDERALAAWFEVVYPRKSERKVGQAAAQGPALFASSDPRCRPFGRARLAGAKTRGRRVAQRLYSVGGVAMGGASSLAAAIAQVAAAQ